ncbi:MAG: YaeQ family protein [Polyangiaceae bacterium]
MALGATMYHLKIDLSDVDRAVYEALDLRVARHPSETMRYLLVRTLAYCLCHEEGISFSKGLSTNDEPAVWIHDLQGNLKAWIEVGNPNAERLHKASKGSPRLVVFTHAPELLLREMQGKTIFKRERIEIFSLEPSFLDALDDATDRNTRWEVVHTDGALYVTIGGKSIEGALTRHELTED